MTQAIDPRRDVTGVILAGGRGARMGGRDKGLEPLLGRPLVEHALERLRPQVAALGINANRHLPHYQSLGVPVWTDVLEGFAGPLAGFQVGLAHCETPWLVTVPCDSPLFPMDLVSRLAQRASADGAPVVMASAREEDGTLRPQPVFCLIRRDLATSLHDFLAGGGRKIDTWTGLHGASLEPFDTPRDAPRAFFNANTLEQLRQLEQP